MYSEKVETNVKLSGILVNCFLLGLYCNLSKISLSPKMESNLQPAVTNMSR